MRGRKMFYRFLLVCLALSLMAGCAPSSTMTPVTREQPTSDTSKKAIVEIKAYQNIEAGCPAELVEFLKAMERRGEITLELIDFSTRAGLAKHRKMVLPVPG